MCCISLQYCRIKLCGGSRATPSDFRPSGRSARPRGGCRVTQAELSIQMDTLSINKTGRPALTRVPQAAGSGSIDRRAAHRCCAAATEEKYAYERYIDDECNIFPVFPRSSLAVDRSVFKFGWLGPKAFTHRSVRGVFHPFM